MKANINDYKIGNYIKEPGQDDDKPFQIWGIYHEKGNDKINNLPINYFQPIPLTESELIKLGFKNYDCEFTKSGFDIYGFNDNTRFEFANHDFPIKIDFVHELQNLYFALTGQELTYEH